MGVFGPAVRSWAWPAAAVLGMVATAAAMVLSVGYGEEPAGRLVPAGLAALSLGVGGAVLAVLDPVLLTARILCWTSLSHGLAQVASSLPHVLSTGMSATIAAWLGTWTAPLFVVPLLTVLPLTFPDAGPLPGRWRRWLYAAAAAVGLLCVGEATRGTIDVGDQVADNPFALAGVSAAASTAGALTWAASALAGVAALVVRWRRGSRDDRLRMNLVAATLVVLIVCYLLEPLLPAPASGAIGSAMPAVLVAAIAVGAVRHGLSNEVGVRRTQLYALAVVGMLGAYVVVLAALARLAGELPAGPAAAVAAGVTLLLLEPARRAVRRHARRWILGDRDDPLAALVRLRAAVEEAGEGEAVLDIAVAQVRRSLAASSVLLEVRVADGLLPVASYGGPVGAGATLDLPLVHLSEDIGLLRVGRAPGEAWPQPDRVLAHHLAAEVAAAVSALRTRAERDAAVRDRSEALELDRHRLGQDLHDTLGPVLAGTYLAAEGLSLRLGGDSADDVGVEQARRIARGVQRASTEVRRMIDGLTGPEPLAAGSLAAALRDHVDGLGQAGGPHIRLDLDMEEAGGRLRDDVARAAYFIVCEALTNVVRHSGASRAEVEIRRTDGDLLVRVLDDGALGTFVAGVGIRSMRLRAAELGGTCALLPRLPRGAELRATLPVGAGAS